MKQFVAVAGDDWYQRQKKGEEGGFFKKVVEQGPREGSGTKQGHYVFTAQGKLLGFNNNRGPERRLAMMRDALRKWEALPDSEKRGEIAGMVHGDEKFQRKLPDGGQVVKVFTRALEESGEGLARLRGDAVGHQTAVDHLWLRKEELLELQKLIASGGGDFPNWFSMRLARFHLRDNTRGEPEEWGKEGVKSWSLKVDGNGQIEGRFDLEKNEGRLGFEGEIRGKMAVDEGGQLTHFECLVLGRQWGEGTYTRGARPGKTPLGQVLLLSEATEARDQIPPQGIRWEEGYWKAERGCP